VRAVTLRSRRCTSNLTLADIRVALPGTGKAVVGSQVALVLAAVAS